MMRWLVLVHRWIGVALCLFFAAWFASGVVMLYVPFPSLSDAQRIAQSTPLLIASLPDSFEAALEPLGELEIDTARIVSRTGRPLLIAQSNDANAMAVYVDSGQHAAPVTVSEAAHLAEDFTGVEVQSVTGPIDFDQWVVHQAFDAYRPYYRVRLADNLGTEIYVSQISGEVRQVTTRRQRAWNYAGAVVHWIYPTLIRKHWALWDQLVWWLAGIGMLGGALGLVLGIVRLNDAWRRGRRGLASPFVGWMRWHHLIGLGGGVFVMTWIFSGWLSMDHGRLFSMPDPTPQSVASFRAISVRDAIALSRTTPLRTLNNVHEIEFSAAAGRAIIVARGPTEQHTFVGNAAGADFEERQLSSDEIETAVASAWPSAAIVETTAIPANDAYANLREGSLDRAVLRTVIDTGGGTWIHVDPGSGKIVSVMDRSRRVYRWLFNGLHSFDFPGFVDRRPLWDIVMISLLCLGLAFSATGIVIGYRRALRLTHRR